MGHTAKLAIIMGNSLAWMDGSTISGCPCTSASRTLQGRKSLKECCRHSYHQASTQKLNIRLLKFIA